MRLLAHRRLLLSVFLLLQMAAITRAGGGSSDNLSTTDLIRRLASKDFKEREKAKRLLMERKGAETALRKALGALDLESSRHAAVLIDELEQRRAKRNLGILRDLAKDGRVDQFIELLLDWPAGKEEQGCWQAAIDLARTLVQIDRKNKGFSRFDPFEKFADVYTVTDRTFSKFPKRKNKRAFFVRADEISVYLTDNPTILASRKDCNVKHLRQTVIYSLGSVEVLDEAVDSIILCDGNVTIRSPSISNCLVLARGTVTIGRTDQGRGIISESTIISTTDMVFDKRVPGIRNSTVVGGLRLALLGFVNFLEPKWIGMEVHSAKGGVIVMSAPEDDLFAKAGGRTQDKIVAVDGQSVESVDVFRRLMRRALVIDEEMTLRIRRGDREIDVHLVSPH